MLAEVERPPFFAVSVRKLVVLSLCTGGLYELYWFFKNWQLESERRGGGRYVGPALHVLFVFFLCYRLFASIARAAHAVGARKLSPGLVAISWVALRLSQRLPGHLWVISAASVVPLALVQATVNRINDVRAPGTSSNARFTLANILVCALGIPIVGLALVDTFVPEWLRP